MSPRTARRVRSLALGVAVATALGSSRGAETPPFVDVHAHLEPGNPRQSVEAALRAMPAENAVRIVFLPPPFTADDPARYDAELLEQLPPDVRRRIGTENAARLVPAAARSER